MPITKASRRSAAARERRIRQEAKRKLAQLMGIENPTRTNEPPVEVWDKSKHTGKQHKLMIPIDCPEKKFVLIAGDSCLRPIVENMALFPETSCSFGISCTLGASTDELRIQLSADHKDMIEVYHKDVSLLCIVAPSNELTFHSIEQVMQSFKKLLLSACSDWQKVCVVVFPPHLNVEKAHQTAQVYQCVAAQIGVTYHHIVHHFPMRNTGLWTDDDVHLSDTKVHQSNNCGIDILMEQLYDACMKTLELPPPPKLVSPLPSTLLRRVSIRLAAKNRHRQHQHYESPSEFEHVEPDCKFDDPNVTPEPSPSMIEDDRMIIEQQIPTPATSPPVLGVQIFEENSSTLCFKTEPEEVEIKAEPLEFPLTHVFVKSEEPESSVLHPTVKEESREDTDGAGAALDKHPESEEHGEDSSDTDDSADWTPLPSPRLTPQTLSEGNREDEECYSSDSLWSWELKPPIKTPARTQGQMEDPDWTEYTNWTEDPNEQQQKPAHRSHVKWSDVGVPPMKDICSFCGKEVSNLSDHERIHTGDRPYICPFCEKCFTRKSHVDRHVRIHTGERPFQCAVCAKGFLSKTSLNVHMNTHREKPFKCSFCPKGFFKKHFLEKHMHLHSRKIIQEEFNEAQ